MSKIEIYFRTFCLAVELSQETQWHQKCGWSRKREIRCIIAKSRAVIKERKPKYISANETREVEKNTPKKHDAGKRECEVKSAEMKCAVYVAGWWNFEKREMGGRERERERKEMRRAGAKSASGKADTRRDDAAWKFYRRGFPEEASICKFHGPLSLRPRPLGVADRDEEERGRVAELASRRRRLAAKNTQWTRRASESTRWDVAESCRMCIPLNRKCAAGGGREKGRA